MQSCAELENCAIATLSILNTRDVLLQGVVQVQRQVIGWFEVSDKNAYSTAAFPVFIFDDPELGEYYGKSLLPCDRSSVFLDLLRCRHSTRCPPQMCRASCFAVGYHDQ